MIAQESGEQLDLPSRQQPSIQGRDGKHRWVFKGYARDSKQGYFFRVCVVPITPQALLEASTGPGEGSRKPGAGNGTRRWPSGERKLRGILKSRVGGMSEGCSRQKTGHSRTPDAGGFFF